MNWPDVLGRIEAGEGARTELKRGLGNFRAIARTLCAFANGNGGLLAIGVDDSGAISGVDEDPESVQERITSFLHSGCGRPLTAECDRHLTGNGWMHWIHVPRHHRGYEPFSYDGRFWVRRGRATVAPSPSELQELFNSFGLVFTERQIVSSATASEIDMEAFESFMRAQGKQTDDGPQPETDDDLRNASVCAELDGVLRPTLYGLMVFGRGPQRYPRTLSLFVQCARYAGLDRAAEAISVGEAKGRLEDQVGRAMGWFQSLGRGERYHGLRREDLPLMPEHVLREAVVNAVIHRDYAQTGSPILLEVFSDRIEVTSPGTLPNHMTVAQAVGGGAPRSRNEMMANAMVVRRLMERRGRGWLLMRRGLREFNGTEPELLNEVDGSYVRVRFRTRSGTEPSGGGRPETVSTR